MGEYVVPLVTAFITGTVSSFGTILVLKTEISWIKKSLDNHWTEIQILRSKK